MAGDWISIEKATLRKPEVNTIARLLNVDRRYAIGLLMEFWAWVDDCSVDGVVDACVDADVDALFTAGFAACLKEVGWVRFEADNKRPLLGRMVVPNWDRHFGESSKKRALRNERQSRWRAKVDARVDADVDAPVDTSASTKASTREEKRREETTTAPQPSAASPPAAKATVVRIEFPDAPDWLPPQTWQSFREHRSRLRKPMTPEAGRLMLKALDRLRKAGHSPGGLLEEAMVRGWLAPVDPNDRGRNSRTPSGAEY